MTQTFSPASVAAVDDPQSAPGRPSDASAPKEGAPGSDPVTDAARRARVAAARLGQTTRAAKDAALFAMADALVGASAEILEANAADVDRAERAGTPSALVDRLRLTTGRIEAMAAGLRQVAGLPDPVGEIVRGSVLPNGLQLRQVRVPLGVVGMIYEARPNVTVDAAGICLKSGNAVLLRGSSSARASNAVLVDVLAAAGTAAGLPENAVQLVPGDDHDSVRALMRAHGLVDVLIPRGGAALIASVVAQSTVPVIETGVGNCHVYVDAAADLDMALAIILNAKTHRPSVCNAAETLLVHADVARQFLTVALPALQSAGVTVHGDADVAALADRVGVPVVPATDDDWATEYLSLDLAVAVVGSTEAALAHIGRWGSGHTEAVVSGSQAVAQEFTARVDAAAVVVNASTRWTDGEQFGFGAEIGISTQKLHARGPMGLPEMTSTKYVLVGDGHVRS